jgi:glyoxylase-like metal-dependent hydrolase (beta-lactamase superfamily II)
MSSADVAQRYFEAIAARDLDTGLALWAPGGVERVVGQREVVAPELWRLIATWDGGPVEIAGAIGEGDRVADFTVIHLPGHAPGLIGLFREALVSDTIYTLDPQTGRHQSAQVPHRAFNQDTDQARASIRKLAGLDPRTVWAGHAGPVTGDVPAQLEYAATA